MHNASSFSPTKAERPRRITRRAFSLIFTVPILPPKPCHMVTFCKFSPKIFILSVFFNFQPVTICHHFTQPIINRTPSRSIFSRQFQPPLFPPRPDGNAKKNYKPTKLSRFRTRIACGRVRSTCADAQAHAGTLERRGAGAPARVGAYIT